MKKLNQQGFSIVEVMVVLSLLIIASLGLLSMFNTSMKTNNRVEGTINVNGLVQAISLHTATPNACSQMLQGTSISLPLTSVNADSKVDFELNLPGIGNVAKNQTLPLFALQLKEFYFSDINLLGVVNGAQYVSGNLYLTPALTKQSSGGAGFKKRFVTAMNLKLVGGLVAECAGSSLLPVANTTSNLAGNTGLGGATTGANGGSTSGALTGANGGSTVSAANAAALIGSLPIIAGGVAPGSITTSCDAACVVTTFFVNNNIGSSTGTNPTTAASTWMANVGGQVTSNFANAYSLNATQGIGGIALNSIATGLSLGFNQAAVDSWMQTAYASYSIITDINASTVAGLVTNTVSGFNSAQAVFGSGAVNQFIATNGIAAANSAALVVDNGLASGFSSAQVAAAATYVTSNFTATDIAAYVANGGTLQSAIDAGLIPPP